MAASNRLASVVSPTSRRRFVRGYVYGRAAPNHGANPRQIRLISARHVTIATWRLRLPRLAGEASIGSIDIRTSVSRAASLGGLECITSMTRLSRLTGATSLPTPVT